jgi:thiol-disulfide isomerase/thioredoxin
MVEFAKVQRERHPHRNRLRVDATPNPFMTGHRRMLRIIQVRILTCFVICFIAVISLGCACHGDELVNQPISIGSVIEDLQFKDIRAVSRNLADLGEHKAYVFMFSTTDCPIVKRTLPKVVELYKKLKERDVVFVSVNVGANDSIRDAASQAIEFDAPFYFVKDYDLSCVRALGVRRTPEFVVLDSEHRLRYRGHFDDQIRIGGTRPMPSRADLEQALEEVIGGKSVSVSETTVDGCLITAPAAPAKDSAITFHRDIAPILFNRCVNCHRSGTAAPFALIEFDEVVANKEMIREVVRDETMPPWYAHRDSGRFQNDCSLSSTEKQTILDWIASGCKQGSQGDSPPVPQPPATDWRIGTPDLILTMLEQHTVPATGFVPYRYAVLPHLFFGETWVEAFEIRPENPSVVHHCNMAYVTGDGAGEDTFITGYVPGGQPMDLSHFPGGVGYRIPAGSGLGLQIHYTTTGKVEKSRIQVGLRFPRNTVTKQLRYFVLDPRGWQIPPHEPAFQMRDSHKLKHEANLLGLFTHMHVRGRDMTFRAKFGDDRQETLLQIPNYNFEWQLGYEIESGTKILPKGTVIEAVAHFDNSDFNPYNPDPTKAVVYGPQTVDEMFNGYVFYVDNNEKLDVTVDPKTGRIK